MRKLKKVIPVIIAFIIGISTTVGAATVFNSKDIKYSSDKTTKTNVKDSLDELYGKVGRCPDGWYCHTIPTTIADNVELGDYISMTPTSTSYTPPKELTGCTTDVGCSQSTLNPSELNMWRVIKKNSDGTVDMISEFVSQQLIGFADSVGYINFVGTLDTIAAQYTNSKYVSKTRHIGYNNQTKKLTNLTAINNSIPTWTTSTSVRNQWTGCDSRKYLCDNYEIQGGGDIKYEADYNLINKVLGTMIGKNKNGEATSYWLASRSYQYRSNDDYFYGGRRVLEDGTLFENGLYHWRSDYGFHRYRGYYAIRPIVTLKSNVAIKSGDGKSAGTSYQLS